MSNRILFVCLGNICRSPTAEAVARVVLPDLQVDSAGTGGWHVGEPPYAPMQAAARARGYNLSGLRARQVVSADFDRFDLIVAMDQDNRAALEELRPSGASAPVRVLTDYAPGAGMDHVPDPYYTRDFDGVLDLIERCIRRLGAAL
ncbi:low molecular weight phosphotyrosine protein phosphatase [Pseudohalocynthiibacter aestuariivivens]|nr:low molecular weight protein-tyrosine-phosphatase [Pseudohalocynthiibacter aestuariivivens]QIE47092.1 low molecular weight phosphotyrosine protein phosphatase [Pseudohalocynthiibacter aestuariivivens]